MQIDWPEARRLMLTSNDVFPAALWPQAVGRLDVVLHPEQVATAVRCLGALYQGLQWARKYAIQVQALGAPTALRHFLIEDEHIIGIFRDCCSAPTAPAAALPRTLGEYLAMQAEGQRLMVADLVLEKESLRLANRWGRGRQSTFVRDLVFPGFMGILAHYGGLFEQLEQHAYLDCLQGQGLPPRTEASLAIASRGGLLTRQLLSDVLYNAPQADAFLADRPPLTLLYEANSPFNIEVAQTELLVQMGDRWRSVLGRSPSPQDDFPDDSRHRWN